jgi:malonyl-CoA decarboxylase
MSLCRSLLSERGEVSGSRLASEILLAHQSLEESDRAAFFDSLAKEFSPDPEQVGRWGVAYRDDPSPENLAQLQRVAEPPRQELFRRLNLAPGGIRRLVEIRRQLLNQLGRNPQWAPIEADLAHLLISWFNRGFLVLERIDWHTPAMVLEKLIQYEAVHEIRGWRDLRRRLEADRRCYAFFHPALPDEPIIFMEVALTRGMSAKVQPLLDPDSPVFDPASANCAMFYSITNCQEGLRGLPFGSFLIKMVAEKLGAEFPRIRTFATISPIPGFLRWLEEASRGLQSHPRYAALAASLARMETTEWFEDEKISAEMQRELSPLCAYYLLHAKRGQEPLDPVARFHLGNGASLDRMNWLGDTSPSGLARSAGLMVNYVYRLAEVERNHEQYSKEFGILASLEIERLAKRSLLADPGQKTSSRPGEK